MKHARRIAVAAPAKINLFLKVVGRRSDGYHDLFSLMSCIDLHDRLQLEFGVHATRIVCNRSDLPCDDSNLALKAVNEYNAVLARETSIRPLSVAIELTKNIPVGAGLGGGSSDAAAILKALNDHYQNPLSSERLARIALSLGADVPFFISGTPALAEGVGEKLTPYPYLPPLHLLLIYPGFGIPTAEVFRSLNLRLTNIEKKLRYSAFKNGELDVITHLGNDLEDPVIKRFPVISVMKKALLDLGALGALMTGSGSSVFGLFPDADGVQRAVLNLAPQPEWQIFATRLLIHSDC